MSLARLQPATAESQSHQANAAGSSSYTAANFLLALTEQIKSNQQRDKRKHPTSDGDEIIILHAITLFRNAESGWRCRASPLDYAHSISQTARDGKSCSGLLFYLGID